MSYYTLPKKMIELKFEVIVTSNDKILPFISHSLYKYLNDVMEEAKNMKINNFFLKNENLTNENLIEYLKKIINPYEYIFTNVHNSNFSVSKIAPFSNLFYVLIEIVNIFNLFDTFTDKNINTMSYGNNSTSVIECIDLLREDHNDKNIKSIIDIKQFTKDDFKIYEKYRSFTYDFLYYELNDDDYKGDKYIISMIYIICNIFYYQNSQGVSIIKIDNIYYKPLVDILYLLSSIYDKVYIIKPNASNVMTNEKYIVCKNFIYNPQKIKLYYMYFHNLNLLIKTTSNKKIFSILKEDIPYYFVNKIEEINIILGHQQLEYMEQLINLFKNKNIEEKIEILKKNNIQKCIQWCEKYKIPYNKFTEKVNIFLNGEKNNEENNNIFLSTKLIEEFEHVLVTNNDFNKI